MLPDSPLFSIVTVTLNCADDAVRTAQSVLAQDFSDYEYIVKDGDSTDGTVERLQALSVPRLVSKPDTSVYNAMNQALQLCRGQYICFMNAGDLFASQSVLSQVAGHIRNYDEPLFVYGDIKSLVRHRYLMPQDVSHGGRVVRYPNQLGRFYLYRNMICHQAWFVRRCVYSSHSFDERFRVLSDFDFLLKVILVERIHYRHIPILVAIFQGGGLTETAVGQMQRERETILRQVYLPWERMLYSGLSGAIRLVGLRFLNHRRLWYLSHELQRGLGRW